MRSGGLRSAARAAARQGDWLSAVRHYEALIRTGRARAGDRIQLGHALKELGDKDAALRAYGEAARLYPLHLDAQRQYGFYLERLDQKPEALNVLARALAIEPEAADIKAQIAHMRVTEADMLDQHMLQGILSGSDAHGQPHSGPIGRFLAARSLGLARESARAHDWPAAEMHYRAVLRHAPDRGNARVQLGHALLEQNRAADALACYRRALLSTPRDPELYLHAGHALKRLRRRDSALDTYLAAWRLRPGLAHVLDEIRGIRPDIDKASLLSDAPDTIREGAGPAASLAGANGRRRLTPPRGLDDRQKAAFKYLAGSISYKD